MLTTDRAKRYAANREAWVAALAGRKADHQTHAEIAYAALCPHMREWLESMYERRMTVSACSCCDGVTLECYMCAVSVGDVEYLFDPLYGGIRP